MNEEYKGYRSPTLELLQSKGASVWSEVTLHTEQGEFSGLILPRSETADSEHIVLKLISGYNLGIRWDRVLEISIRGRRMAQYKIPEQA